MLLSKFANRIYCLLRCFTGVGKVIQNVNASHCLKTSNLLLTSECILCATLTNMRKSCVCKPFLAELTCAYFPWDMKRIENAGETRAHSDNHH